MSIPWIRFRKSIDPLVYRILPKRPLNMLLQRPSTIANGHQNRSSLEGQLKRLSILPCNHVFPLFCVYCVPPFPSSLFFVSFSLCRGPLSCTQPSRSTDSHYITSTTLPISSIAPHHTVQGYDHIPIVPISQNSIHTKRFHRHSSPSQSP